LVDGVIGHASDHVAEVGEGLDLVAFAGTDETVEDPVASHCLSDQPAPGARPWELGNVRSLGLLLNQPFVPADQTFRGNFRAMTGGTRIITQLTGAFRLTTSHSLEFHCIKSDFEQLPSEPWPKDQLFRAAFENAGIGMAILQPDGRLVRVNTALTRILGHASAELTTCDFVSLTHQDDVAADLAQFRKLVQGQIDHYALEKRFFHKQGHVVYGRLNVAAVRDANGTITYIIGQVEDITDQKKLEAQIIETRDQFQSLVTNIPGVTFRCHLDRYWTMIYMSDAVEQLTGYPAEAFVHNRDLSYASIILPCDADRVDASVQRAIDEGRPWEIEYRIVRRDGRIRWVHERGTYILDENEAIAFLDGFVLDITERVETQEKMRRLIQEDHLTGLASRSKLLERLDHAIAQIERSGKHCAVLFFDFDRFKLINDSLGHDVGDELLLSIAHRLSANIREVDTAARFGGDEFVVLIEDLQDTSEARVVADKLLDVCAEPHLLRGRQLVSTASIGLVTTAHGVHGRAQLLRDADAAMYQAKANGRGCVVEFDQAMHDANLERLAIEEDIREAINLDQFTVHYQPIVELESGQPIGAEALARWTHPERGPISPGVFIPIAEESNQIQSLGKLIIRKVCAQIMAWKEKRVMSSGFTVSVNLSKSQLTVPDFPEQLAQIVQASGIEPSDLKIEVTETTIVDNRVGVAAVLQRLRAIGFIVVMDDFGTGHSSLSGLHTLPIDELKIDKSFILQEDMPREIVAITSSIVTLAEHLSLQTVGEGVEDLSHAALLQDMGCDHGQGWLFSKPLPACDFERWMSGKPDPERAGQHFS
jgi:diguanylate cyclase (GGDEF)-like protein/PAS domain S-box-containing protein